MERRKKRGKEDRKDGWWKSERAKSSNKGKSKHEKYYIFRLVSVNHIKFVPIILIKVMHFYF